MILVLNSSPVESISRWDNGDTFTVLPMSDVLPREQVEVNSLAEVNAAFDAWKERVKATGKPAVVSMHQHHRCRARKFNGFKKTEARRVYLNLKAAPIKDYRKDQPAQEGAVT